MLLLIVVIFRGLYTHLVLGLLQTNLNLFVETEAVTMKQIQRWKMVDVPDVRVCPFHP